MLEAKVIFFKDNESHDWFEQFFRNSNVLPLLVNGRTRKIGGEVMRERKKTRNGTV